MSGVFFFLSASSCCLQIPFDTEEIRRALIAVHNFAVPQIKVLFSFSLFIPLHPTLMFVLQLEQIDNTTTLGNRSGAVHTLHHHAEMSKLLQPGTLSFAPPHLTDWSRRSGWSSSPWRADRLRAWAYPPGAFGHSACPEPLPNWGEI